MLSEKSRFIACRGWWHPMSILCLLDDLGHDLGIDRIMPTQTNPVCELHDRALMALEGRKVLRPKRDWIDTYSPCALMKKFRRLPQVDLDTSGLKVSVVPDGFARITTGNTSTCGTTSVTYTYRGLPKA